VILVLRSLGVGDLAASVPALRALRSGFADRPLVLAAPGWLTPLIDLVGGVDRVLSTDGLDVPAWRIEPPAVAVNLHGRGPESHRLLRNTGPARLWAFANPGAGHVDGPAWDAEEHEVSRWCRLVGHYGRPADPGDLSLAVPSVEVARDVTVIHPGAKSPSRRWPVERFAAVARELAGAGHRVVVTGTEQDPAEAVARRSGAEMLHTTLAELAGVVAHARLVVSGDTGIAHLATAYGTPSVVLFGPVPPSRWGPPPGRARHRPIWHGVRADRGDSPGPDVHPALLAIGVDEVLQEAGEAERHAAAAQ
jgi:ADP-heptose:LPS heptosyltransferase